MLFRSELGLDLRVEEHRIGRRDRCLEFGDLGVVGEDRLVGVENVQERLGGEQVRAGWWR